MYDCMYDMYVWFSLKTFFHNKGLEGAMIKDNNKKEYENIYFLHSHGPLDP